MRTDAEVAAAGASRSQESMLELLLDPAYSVLMDCCFTQFLQVFFCFCLSAFAFFSSVLCLPVVQLT